MKLFFSKSKTSKWSISSNNSFMTKIGFLDKFLQKIIFSGTFLQTKYLLMKINVVKIKKKCHLAYSTKILWCILIYRIMPLQVQNINYDEIYYILEFFCTPKSKNGMNKRYLNTINCVTMSKNAYLSYLQKNVLIAIRFYSIYQLNS